jgi:3-oxoacyl-[acyl-carrier-protein] synthase II
VGSGADATWRAFQSGERGLGSLALFQSPRYGQVLAGEVREDLSALGAPKQGSRSDRLGWLAARQAIQSARIDTAHVGERGGVLLGASVGGSYDSERFLGHLIRSRKMWARPIRYHECVSTAEWIADQFRLYGPTMALATACSSGALAIATAAEMILAGEAEVMLAGGADSLSRMTWGGFQSLLLVDAAGCRPFDANRAGMSLGEGAAIVVIESEQHAALRGARVLARLSGWGMSCDAHHATAPHPQGAGAAQAMQSALDRATLPPESIEYVNAHGTATRDNDLAEGNALKTVFGERLPRISSTKGFFGHSLAASGAIEAVVCIEALRRQELPPNIGFETVDPVIGIVPVTRVESARLMHVMSNSFGFGGNNAVLIFSQPQTKAATRLPRKISVAVKSLGSIGPGSRVEREIKPPLPSERIAGLSCGELPDLASLSPNQRRRLGRLIQMALIAARRSHQPESGKRLAVAIGTGLGCLEDAEAFIENLIAKEEREPMPARFPNSVHNALASQVAIDQKATGLNSAPTVGEISFECGLWQVINQLAVGEADLGLAGAADELNDYTLSIGKRWGLWNDRILPGEGAMVASVARDDAAGERIGMIETVRLGRYRRPFDPEVEAAWISSAVDLKTIEVLLTGAHGSAALEPLYQQLVSEVQRRRGVGLRHETYKDQCGEFHSASAFGFSRAVELVRKGAKGVVVYTLAERGSKALSVIRP